MLARKGSGSPVGSLTQIGTIRLGKRTDNRTPKIKDFVPLAALDDIVFGAWDFFPDNASKPAEHADVLDVEAPRSDLRTSFRDQADARRCSTPST